MTKINLGNIRFNWRGNYDEKTIYHKDDVVYYKSNSYVAKKETTGTEPYDDNVWDVMVTGLNQMNNKGDIITHNGVKPVALPLGKEAQILQVSDGNVVWRNAALPPDKFVIKLQKVSGFGSVNTRIYLMADGTIKSCGSGSNHSNGDITSSHRHIPSRVTAEDNKVKFIDVYSGNQSHYALTAEGDVWSWGYNALGQLGHGNTANLGIMKRIDFFYKNNIKIKKIFVNRPNASWDSCAYFLTDKGLLYACGANTDGNLGNGTLNHQSTPIRCGSLENVIDFCVSGRPFTCYAVTANGDLWVWGWNAYGQLGLGDKINRSTPILHPSIKKTKKVLVINGWTAQVNDPAGCGFALLEDGSIWATGWNGHGNLGVGDKTQRSSFTKIDINDFIIDITAGNGRFPSIAAITNKKELFTWGNGYRGVLGNISEKEELTPIKPKGLFQNKVIKVVIAGGLGVEGCIIETDDNELWATGYSGKYNLGTGSNNGVNHTFQKVFGIHGKIKEWGAFGHPYTDWGLGVLYEDGRVDACGYNETFGETGTQSASLHNVGTLTNVIF